MESPASTVADTPTPIPKNFKNRHRDEDSEDQNLLALPKDMGSLMDLIDRLRSEGIENLDIPLPRIAVVGNQSAGKSSLIEAISGVCTHLALLISMYVDADSLLSSRSRSRETLAPAPDVHLRLPLNTNQTSRNPGLAVCL